jgi:hypothetical protein
MAITFGKKPYKFDINGGAQHHLGRCYISDFEKTHKILNTINEYGILRLDDFPIVFPTSRAENWREQLIEMWRTGFNIGIVPYGAGRYGFAYLGTEKVPNKNIVEEFTIQNRKTYPYTLFFLDLINESSDGITENELAQNLFTKNNLGEIKKGSIDQTHPTMDDLTRWGFVSGGKNGRIITEKGKKVLKDNKNDNFNFICYNMDLNKDNNKSRILWSLLRTIEGEKKLPTYPFLQSSPPYKVNLTEVMAKYNSAGLGKNRKSIIDSKEIIDLFDELNIKYHTYENYIVLKQKIFFSITPQGYVKAGLSQMDQVNNYTKQSYLNVEVDEKKLSENYWVLSDQQDINLSDYPSEASVVNYKEWLKLKDNLANKFPKTIIISPGWSPALLEASCGHILSFVQNGGYLIIHGPQGGRIGTNRQFFNWLPLDFERLNYITNTKKWVFDSRRLKGEKIQQIYCEEFSPNTIKDTPQIHFHAKYGSGKFIFEGNNPSKKIYKEIIKKYGLNDLKIISFEKTPSWKWRRFAQLYRDEDILVEQNIYPIFGDDVLQKEFGFNLSESFCYCWVGAGSIVPYVDLFTIMPAITLWEIDSIKGKQGILKGIAGDSVAVDIGHAEKCIGYQKQAENQYYSLLRSIDSCNEKDLIKFKNKILEDINKLEKYENFQMKEIFEKYLDKYLINSKSFNKKEFYDFVISSNKLIDNRPSVSLVGVSYGFPEGSKLSAREISKRDKYSLWTYRDIYEFLIKVDKMDKPERLKKMLHILNKRDGPVYNHISQI